MEYKVYKLKFQGAVHFGRRNLEDGEYTFCADMLFSALFQEALKMDENASDCLLRYVQDGKLLLSDAFPYIGGTYFLPKPMKRITVGHDHGDSKMKKALKKLKYIPVQELENYLLGRFDVRTSPDMEEALGDFQMKVSAAVRGEEETKPYRIGNYYYRQGNGLYVIIGYEDAGIAEFVEQLLMGVGKVGIGGKKTSGAGKFELMTGKMPEELRERLIKQGERYMTLSLSLPRDDELEDTLMEAEYILVKRSGFVDSSDYAREQRRKKDLYVIKTGAYLKTRFEGDVYNVADGSGSHPVYRYAKPMFMEVDV